MIVLALDVGEARIGVAVSDPTELLATPRGTIRRRSNAQAIEAIARAVVAKSPANVAKYRSGSEGVFKFFVGQVMKETRGQANPQIVNEILKRVLAEG